MMPAMSEIHSSQLELFRTWVFALQAQHRISLSELARRAGLAESTITRMMNPDGPGFLPRESTLAKLEKAFQTRRPVSMTGLPSGPDTAETGAETDPRLRAARVVETLQEMDLSDPAGLNAYTVADRALDLAGYLPDDIVLIDDTRRPEPGDIVALRYRGGAARPGLVTLRIYDQPFLTAHSTDAALRRPILDDGEKLEILGTVTTALRARRRPAK